MLRVAASPSCDVIHGRVSAVLCSLLHALRPRAPITFNVIAKEMLGLAQDLSNLLYTHTHSHTPGTHKHSTNTHTLWPVTLQSFSVSLTPYLTPSPLLLPSPAALETLVAVTVNVLTDALRGLASRREMGVAWRRAVWSWPMGMLG